MKKALPIILVIYLIGLIYLVLPSPQYPDLTGGARSDEEGDTWQNPDQKGFYTNMDRAAVLKDIQSQFVIKIGNIALPTFRLNYAPEEARIIIRDQLESYYLEEIVYPFRESLFVNGWEPKKSPGFANRPAKEIPEISLHGIPYNAKITLKPQRSSVFARVLVWTLTFPAIYLVFLSLKKSFSKNG